MTLPISPLWGIGNGGRPPASTPSAAAFPQAAAVLQVPLPEISPIPDARQFNTEGHDGTAGAGTRTLADCTVVVPVNNKFIINSFSVYVDNMLTTTEIHWAILVNGVPQQGWSDIKLFPRLAPFVGDNLDPFLRGEGEATITVQIRQVDGGGYIIGAAVGGWYWPKTSDQRWKAGDVSW